MKKIAVIGGGAAGLTAAVYALRANSEVVLFEQFGLGGLIANIDKIENFPSYQSVEGWRLANDMANQAKKLGLEVVRQRVLSLTKNDDGFVIKTDKDEYVFPGVVVSTGTAHNKLGIEDAYVGKGVSYCATCDGNFYKGQPVAVVGGGNQAVREALYLSDICSEVYFFVPSSHLNAEEINVRVLESKQNVKIVFDSSVAKIYGEEFVSGVSVFCGGETFDYAVNGVFVAIGALPVSDFIQIDGLNKEKGYLVVGAKCETSVNGLFAAGDVTQGSLKQIVTACADGAKAGSFAAAYAAMVTKNK
ncbi:MAG: FAD-dependent oxidoreductase [Clostridia bacterium]|nr:FAD-dependent oxidoreductase [Clostridia bacterium]